MLRFGVPMTLVPAPSTSALPFCVNETLAFFFYLLFFSPLPSFFLFLCSNVSQVEGSPDPPTCTSQVLGTTGTCHRSLFKSPVLTG